MEKAMAKGTGSLDGKSGSHDEGQLENMKGPFMYFTNHIEMLLAQEGSLKQIPKNKVGPKKIAGSLTTWFTESNSVF